MHRYNICMCMAHVCCVAGVIKDIVFLALECMLCVCVKGVIDVMIGL